MQVLNALFYGLPLEQLQTFRERVNAVTVDDIQRVARDLPAARSPVGRARRQRGGVRGAAAQRRLRHVRDGGARGSGSDVGEFQEGTDQGRWGRSGRSESGRLVGSRCAGGPGGAGRSGSDVVQAFRPATQQAPATSRPAQEPRPEEGARAVALLDRAIAAKGGLETLRALKTIIARQTQASQRPEGETKVETTNYIQYPNRFRVEAPELVQVLRRQPILDAGSPRRARRGRGPGA